MKKHLIVYGIFLLTLVFGLSAGAHSALAAGGVNVAVGDINSDGQVTFTITLTAGSKNNEVKALQALLISKGFLPAGGNTGTFGSTTVAAVKKFQTANGLPATGTIGALTRAKLNSFFKIATNDSPVPTERSLSVGNCVGKEMIAINTDGSVHIRGKLTLSSPMAYEIKAWGYVFAVDHFGGQAVGSFANGTFVVGDVFDVTGTFPGTFDQIFTGSLNMFGGKINNPVIRDESADCRASTLNGSGNASAHATSTAQ